jgi:hypothetical protein
MERTDDLSGHCNVPARLKEIASSEWFEAYKKAELEVMIAIAKEQWAVGWPGEPYDLTVGEWEVVPEHMVKDPETGEVWLELEAYRCYFNLHRSAA